ncbi:MAG: S-adenosylmethionine:tRNA ribosyltransferase-isomerase, partial [Gemmatimonadota bacterium]
MNGIASGPLEFELPAELSAQKPPEARGLTRDAVRLMVSRASDDSIVHTRFRGIGDFLQRGDVLVVNASATINASLTGVRQTARRAAEDVALHLSTPLGGDRWVIELRRWTSLGSAPILDAQPGDVVHLRARGQAALIGSYRGSSRLWIARLQVPGTVLGYAAQYGSPIRYGYVKRVWPLPYYQTVFAREPGSAEMPSAGRPFTIEHVRRLESKGVQVVPIVLHAGVSSLEAEEEPFPERYRVSPSTAAVVNRAHTSGGRVVGVGTTVARALETVAAFDGTVGSGSGWTDLVITPERGFRT